MSMGAGVDGLDRLGGGEDMARGQRWVRFIDDGREDVEKRGGKT